MSPDLRDDVRGFIIQTLVGVSTALSNERRQHEGTDQSAHKEEERMGLGGWTRVEINLTISTIVRFAEPS